jgi:hypothetical protein
VYTNDLLNRIVNIGLRVRIVWCEMIVLGVGLFALELEHWSS